MCKSKVSAEQIKCDTKVLRKRSEMDRPKTMLSVMVAPTDLADSTFAKVLLYLEESKMNMFVILMPSHSHKVTLAPLNAIRVFL